jgi:hypothetical protein
MLGRGLGPQGALVLELESDDEDYEGDASQDSAQSAKRQKTSTE